MGQQLNKIQKRRRRKATSSAAKRKFALRSAQRRRSNFLLSAKRKPGGIQASGFFYPVRCTGMAAVISCSDRERTCSELRGSHGRMVLRRNSGIYTCRNFLLEECFYQMVMLSVS